MACWWGSVSRAGSGMIRFRLARNCSIRRALVPGRSAGMPRISASWTGVSAPTQAGADPQAPGGKAADLFLPSLGTSVRPELGQQGLRGRGQRWQLVQRPDGDAAPIAAGVEQRPLPRDGQVRRHWRRSGGRRAAARTRAFCCGAT